MATSKKAEPKTVVAKKAAPQKAEAPQTEAAKKAKKTVPKFKSGKGLL